MPELTHDELNRGIAELLGYTFVDDPRYGPFWKRESDGHYLINDHDHWSATVHSPNFAGSLDALQEAERGLKERGYWLRVEDAWDDSRVVSAVWYKRRVRRDPVVVAVAPTESEARARALYAALKAEKEAGE